MLIASMHVCDIYVLVEPWLSTNFSLNLSGFTSYYFPHSSGYSGLLILIRNGLHHRFRSDITVPSSSSLHSSSMLCWFEFFVPSIHQSVLLSAVYISPSATYADVSLILSSFSSALSFSMPLFLIGDFNARHAVWSSGNDNMIGNRLFSFCSANHLFILNPLLAKDKPTHNSSTIDLAITSHPALATSLSVLNQDIFDSDHCAIILSLSFPDILCPRVPHHRWNIHSADWDLYKTCLSDKLSSWFSSFAVKLSDLSINLNSETAVMLLSDAWSSLLFVIIEVALLTIKKSYITSKSKHWWSYSYVRDEYKLFRKCRRRFTRWKNSARVRSAFNAARKRWRAIVARAKAEFFGLVWFVLM
jgi:hypothetical protein